MGVFMLFICHYVACLWVWVAYNHVGGTWLRHLDGDENPLHHYMASLHWSLTQFMPAPMDIGPTNATERCFAICIVLCACVVFSSFVGGITAKITEIRQLKQAEIAKEEHLRRYLSVRGVSFATGHGIWTFLKKNKSGAQKHICEADVEVLDQIPTSLRMKLRREVFGSSLLNHPLFPKLGDCDSRLITSLCYEAMTELPVKPLQEVFVDEEVAQGMYIVASGSMEYRSLLLNRPLQIHGNRAGASCVSEASLWGTWLHCGDLVAQTICELVVIEPKLFMRTVTLTYFSDFVYSSLRRYAIAFAEHTTLDRGTVGHPVITDVTPTWCIHAMMEVAFPMDARTSQKSTGDDDVVSIAGLLGF